MGGEVRYLSRPISFGWLRVYYYLDVLVVVGACMMCTVLIVPSLLSLSWACRTPVVNVLATTVLCCNVLLSTLLFRCIVDGWGLSRPADVSMTSEAIF